jgi:DNA-binding transcriptional regulator YhcF (GntR family)
VNVATTPATLRVLEALQQLEQKGKLAAGDQLPTAVEMRPIIGIKTEAYTIALWELAVKDVVSRLDGRYFWRGHPAHTRTQEQVRQAVLRCVTLGLIEEQQSVPSSSTLGETFNLTPTTALRAIRPLMTQQIISTSKRGPSLSRVLPGGQAKAVRALELFRFEFTAIEQTVDTCFSEIEQQQTLDDAVKAHNYWRRYTLNDRACARSLCIALLRQFGATETSPRGVGSIRFTVPSQEVLRERVALCRQWLRRHHVTHEGDPLLIAMQCL